jgi:hypothetical protein
VRQIYCGDWWGRAFFFTSPCRVETAAIPHSAEHTRCEISAPLTAENAAAVDFVTTAAGTGTHLGFEAPPTTGATAGTAPEDSRAYDAEDRSI